MIRNRTFRNEDVVIDGEVFLDCTVVDCRMHYSAYTPVRFTRCTFGHCKWVFDGPAKYMIEFLSGVANGLGPEGRALVESIFGEVMSGVVLEELEQTYPPIPA